MSSSSECRRLLMFRSFTINVTLMSSEPTSTLAEQRAMNGDFLSFKTFLGCFAIRRIASQKLCIKIFPSLSLKLFLSTF
ncbi:PREDICTED: uncharacterized protein LOC104777608 isoform X4 [Camelina sativa]|uniref:Uncharacterized protein LOC104777608 isoform X4 n=1 Tax=Camelina sativa TaxID=90675 RepID=A0ABM0YFL5_CAMSA|nr:PREDICTED: uncharacterized protein LOC104777608 isoform X4 [Camelina sativa]